MRARAHKKKKAPTEAAKTPPPPTPAAASPPAAEVAPHRPTPDPQQPPVVAPVLMPKVGLEVPASELAVVVGAIAAGGIAETRAPEPNASAASQLSNTQHEGAPAARHGDGQPPSAGESDEQPSHDAPPRAWQAVADDDGDDTWRAPDEARLLVQSPRRLYLYWRFARDPRELLREALGPVAERLAPAVRLVDVANGEEGRPAPAEGDDYWFDVLPGRLLRAEVGFHGEGLPFVRLISSNTVETPAVGVSRAADEAPEFRVAAEEFGRVLEATGFAAKERPDERARRDAEHGRSFSPEGFDEPTRPRASSDTARPASSPRDGGQFSNTRGGGGELF